VSFPADDRRARASIEFRYFFDHLLSGILTPSIKMWVTWGLLSLAGLVSAQCPYMDASPGIKQRSEIPEDLETRAVQKDADFLEQFVVDDSNSFITSDAGGPIEDNHSLKAGERGPTLLEDFIFRQKIQHFDHERVFHCSKTNQTFRALLIH
jgi:hypothetical protein